MRDYESPVSAPFHQTTDHPMDFSHSLSQSSFFFFRQLFSPFGALRSCPRQLYIEQQIIKEVREGKQRGLFAFYEEGVEVLGALGEISNVESRKA